MTPVLYKTGETPEGKNLVGGLWTFWAQEGFPIEMQLLLLEERGLVPDWAEAMADASRSNELPALMGVLEGILPEGLVLDLKGSFSKLLSSGISPDQLLSRKRKNTVTK